MPDTPTPNFESNFGSDVYIKLTCYSGPEGALVKVPPLFFVIIIIFIIIITFVFCAPNFLRGYKAQTRIEPGY